MLTYFKRLLKGTDDLNLETLALVASKTDNAVIITDREGKIEWVNDGFERISGYTLEEASGRKPGHLLQGPDTDPETVEGRGHDHARCRRGELLCDASRPGGGASASRRGVRLR